jgi:hypothetical protein
MSQNFGKLYKFFFIPYNMYITYNIYIKKIWVLGIYFCDIVTIYNNLIIVKQLACHKLVTNLSQTCHKL